MSEREPRRTTGRSQGRPQRSPRARSLARWRQASVDAVNVILAVGFVVGLAFFARPSTSGVEMRELTKFPSFSLEGFLDGSFTSDLSLWYADTYPLREPLVAADQWLEARYGIDTGTKMIGGNVVADELPPEGEQDAQEPTEPAEPEEREEVEVPTEDAMAADIQNQIMNGLYVHDGAAYSIYYFSQEAIQSYTGPINAYAQTLVG